MRVRVLVYVRVNRSICDIYLSYLYLYMIRSLIKKLCLETMSAVLRLKSGGRGRAEVVIVTSKPNELTRRQVAAMRSRRTITNAVQ